MDISGQDSNHLILQERSGRFTFLAILFVIIAGLMQLFRSAEILECNRSSPDSGECRVTFRESGDTQIETIAIDPTLQVVLREIDRENENTNYLIELQSESAHIKVNQFFSSGYERHKRVFDQIKVFLQDKSQTTLLLQQKNNALALALGGFFILLALCMILLPSSSTLDLDRRSGMATLRRKSLISSRRVEIPLNDLAGAEVQVSASKNTFTYRVAVIHRDGNRTPMTTYFSSGLDPKQAMANEINRFLGVPLSGENQVPYKMT